MTRTERKAYLNELWLLLWHNKGDGIPDWSNRELKRFIEWNLAYRKLFVVRDGDKMVAAGAAWRIRHPDDFDQINSNLSWEATETGDYLYIPYVVVREGHRRGGALIILLHMALKRYQGVTQIMYHRLRKGKRMPVIMPITRILRLLLGATRHGLKTA